MTIGKEIEEYIFQLNDSDEILQEYTIGDNIKEIIGHQEVSDHELYDYYAFSYSSGNGNNNTSWDMHYGPMMSGVDENGIYHSFPPIDSVNESTLDFFIERFNSLSNPILKYRYADLSVDFSEKLGKKLNIDAINAVVNSAIELCDDAHLHPVDLIKKLRRAVNLAKKINNNGLLQKLKKSSIKLEDKIAEDDKPGLWGFTLNIFHSKYGILDSEEIELQVNKLENRRLRLIKGNQVWALQSITEILLDYYFKLDKKDCQLVVNLLKDLELAISNNHEKDNHPIKVLHDLEYLKNLSHKYIECTDVETLNKSIQKKIYDYDPKWEENLKSVSAKIEVKQEDIDRFIASVFDDQDITKVIAKIVLNFIQNIEDVQQQLEDLQKKYPFQYLATRSTIGREGKIIADSGKDAEEQHERVRLYTQNMIIQDLFLSEVLDVFFDRYTTDELKTYLVKCDLIQKDEIAYLDRILHNISQENFIEVSALVTPYIERLVRRLSEINGEITYVPDNRYGGYKYRTLHELLMNPSLSESYKSMRGDDVVEYLKVVLTNKVGLNLRNDFGHGENLTILGKQTAYRLIHVLLILSLIKIVKKNAG